MDRSFKHNQILPQRSVKPLEITAGYLQRGNVVIVPVEEIDWHLQLRHVFERVERLAFRIIPIWAAAPFGTPQSGEQITHPVFRGAQRGAHFAGSVYPVLATEGLSGVSTLVCLCMPLANSQTLTRAIHSGEASKKI